jgi:hypothetical protein
MTLAIFPERGWIFFKKVNTKFYVVLLEKEAGKLAFQVKQGERRKMISIKNRIIAEIEMQKYKEVFL